MLMSAKGIKHYKQNFLFLVSSIFFVKYLENYRIMVYNVYCRRNPMLKVRFLNGVYTGGCATLQKGVVAMIKYILRIIFFIIVFLVAFTIKVK